MAIQVCGALCLLLFDIWRLLPPFLGVKKMKAEYIDSMGDDLRVVNGARTTFDNWKYELSDRDSGLVSYLARNHETEPFRHVLITMRITAPIFIARQLAKHQVGMSWSEVSRRYVTSKPYFFCPSVWRGAPTGGAKQGSSEDLAPEKQAEAHEAYERTINMCERSYYDLLDIGVAPEQARMLLPQSMYTTWVWTGSLQAFSHLVWLRVDAKAQSEVSELGRQIDEICRSVAPLSWSCLLGRNQ